MLDRVDKDKEVGEPRGAAGEKDSLKNKQEGLRRRISNGDSR